MDGNIEEINQKLKLFALHSPQVEYYDANNYLCKNKNCTAYSKLGRALFYDPSHLSIPGSWELGREIIKNEGVPYPFNSLTE